MPPAGPEPKRILIVRPSALGDVCRTVPALVTLRAAHRGAQIDWLVHDVFVDAISHHPDLSGVVLFPRQRFASFVSKPRVAAEALAWAAGLGRRRYDLVFDLQGLLRSGVLTRLTRAPRRVGFANARELGWLGYNRRHEVDQGMHTVDRMLSLLEAEGYALKRDMALYVDPRDAQWLEEFLAGGAGEAYACLAPTARWRCKAWPIESYVKVSRRLVESGIAGSRIVVLAAPDQREQVRPLVEALGDRAGRILFPRTSVGQMLAVLRRAALVVCNDSAPLHVAVGFGRPLVCVFGPTDPDLVGPYGRSNTVVQPPDIRKQDMIRYRHRRDDQSLIAKVTPEAVWRKIEEQMGTGGREDGGLEA